MGGLKIHMGSVFEYNYKSKNISLKVFWNCRKEPPDSIKNNFDYEMFPNEGLEWGGYQQIYEKFKFEDEDIIFFTHDDIVIKTYDDYHNYIQK